MLFKKTTISSAQPLRYLPYLSFDLLLLNLFFNNVHIYLEGPLNCICSQISIKLYVFFRQNSMYHVGHIGLTGLHWSTKILVPCN